MGWDVCDLCDCSPEEVQKGLNVPKLRESGAVRRRCNLSHALKRAMERWRMSMEDVEEVESKITAYYTGCNAPFVKYLKSDSFHADRHIYSVEVRDLVVPVVWCETTKTVVTFLPPDFMNTVASEWIPATVRQCGEFIDAMGKELNRLAQEIAASKKGTLERDSLQATYREKVVELNRLKLLRDTHYDVTAEMRNQEDDPVFIISKLNGMIREMLHESGQQAEPESAMQFVLSAAKKYLKSHGKT